MTDSLQPLLEEASREELQSALQLLALSIVQHRARAGFVAFQESAAELKTGVGDTDGLFSRGRDILAEALQVARELSSETDAAAHADAREQAESIENRRQLRVNVRAPIKVLWDIGGEPVAARLENISWGGAAIQVASMPSDAHDKLHLLLPTMRGSEIMIEANLLRTWDLDDDAGFGMATRFSSLSTKDEAEFEKLLELLSQSGDDGQREHARLTQRLEIEFDGDQALQATLDDISSGGLGITVPDPLEIGQSLQAVISTMDGNCALKLRARVIRQNVITHGRAKVYHAGLKFEHPSEELRELTNTLIEQLASRRR